MTRDIIYCNTRDALREPQITTILYSMHVTALSASALFREHCYSGMTTKYIILFNYITEFEYSFSIRQC